MTTEIILLLLTTLFISSELFLADLAGAQVPLSEPASAPSEFRLVGTVGGTAFSGAVLADAGGVHFFYRLYDKLPDGSQIVKVRDKSILLKHTDGLTYELFVTQGKKTAVQVSQPTSARPTTSEEVVPKAGTDQPRPRRRNRVRKLANEE